MKTKKNGASNNYPVSKPDLKGNELKYLTECIKTGWISSQGSFVERFEEEFARFHRTDYGCACSSGTNALVLALRALNIGEGDEVIVPDFTMIASAWAVSMVGATPVFVDCNDKLLIDTELIEEAITYRTKAIMPVHIYGRVCDMSKIMDIAKEYNLKVVEDSCEAHSVRPSGDIACYSLFANKVISSGEGGICLTNDKNLAWQIKHLRAMCFNKDHTFYHPKFGYNFRMTNLQAAVALAQTERMNKFLEKREQIEKWYDQELADIPQIKIMPQRNVVWMYDILADKRDKLIWFLKENGIETRMFFKPMSSQPMYRDNTLYLQEAKSYHYSEIGLYLPTYTDLELKDIKFISSKIKSFYA
jgi:dTDP-4-amino-4,6-dideoxygalactose transaminase